MDSIKVFAPATVANVSCGFDVMGFALDSPGDEIVLKKTKRKGIFVKEITGDGGKLSKEVDNNTATVAIQSYLNHIGKDIGLEVFLHKKMPLGSGLGSSAASAVAGVFAVNELLGGKLTRNELLPFAMEGEKLASGDYHADNVAPSLLGGFRLIRGYDPLDVIKITTPKNMWVSVVHPALEINTKAARGLLSKEVALKKAIQQWGNVGGLIAGLITEDYGLIGRSMKDVIIEPVRSKLLSGYEAVKQAALDNSAVGCGISGSGPAIFTFNKDEQTAQNVGLAMKTAFLTKGITSNIYCSKINQNGAIVLD